jgi:hypothetical protein
MIWLAPIGAIAGFEADAEADAGAGAGAAWAVSASATPPRPKTPHAIAAIHPARTPLRHTR